MLIVLLMASLCSCGQKQNNQVVVYTSVDQIYSEPVMKAFEAETGITVKVVYDVEAQKTTGLAVRLEAEKNNPQADVFWNGEFTKTVALIEKDVLSEYKAFGGRARVLLINTEKVKPENYPQTITELFSSKYESSKIVIANPLFGTSFSQSCAIYALLGDKTGREFFENVKSSGIMIAEGNSVVKDLVASGGADMGLTDTDDAYDAIKKGLPVEMIFLDQEKDGMGTLISPNTIAIVKGAKHINEAHRFLEFITSDETLRQLYDSGWIDFVDKPEAISKKRFDFSKIQGMNLNLEDICASQDIVIKDLIQIFMK